MLLFLFSFCKVQGRQLNKPVTLHEKDVEFRIVLKIMKRQTGFQFSYNSDVLKIVGKVTVNADNEDVLKVLADCLKDHPLRYIQKGNKIGIYLITEKAAAVAVAAKRDEKKGTVLNEHSDSLTEAEMPKENVLDEVLVIAYGITSRRKVTGEIGIITNKELSNYRTNDIPDLLSGRIPRLLVTQTNGLPESYSKIQLDGQASAGSKPGRLPFTDPMFVVDGVPFAPNNNSIQVAGSGSALGTYGRSALDFIDPNNIDHIEVLKDADATAIYGSRGARGVIIISTKQGTTGKLKATADVRFGYRTPTRLPHMLNTQQYLQMRQEALNNDTAVAQAYSDIDLLQYDSTRYLDPKKELLGKRAKSQDIIYAFSGGKNNIRYYFGANYHKETTVFSGDLGSTRADLFLHLNYASPDERLTASVTANYSYGIYHLINTDLTQSLLMAPNSPALRNAANKTNWGDPGMIYQNPVAFLDQKYNSQTQGSLISLIGNYRLTNKWCLKINMGQNDLWSSETSIIPIASINPYVVSPLTGSAFFATNVYKSIIVEPYLEYTNRVGQGQFTVVGGNSWQRITNENSGIEASGYTTDYNYSDTAGATSVKRSGPPKSMYKYQGLFGRVSFNWNDKYISNLNARMDWSSRYGLIRVRKDFAALGMAWIFSKESFFEKINFISFGKLHASYGITGNDPIGDMQYFDAWGQDSTGYYLAHLTHNELSAEVTRKINAGIDLAFLKDKLLLTITWFNNRSCNLLVSPVTSSTFANWPVKVQNAGFDGTLRYGSDPKKKMSWSAEILLTIPTNKLIAFPGLATSPYAHLLEEGKSLTRQKAYHFLGVDPMTGIFRFEDRNNDGHIDEQDLKMVGNLDPKVYGGLKFDLSFNNWHFGFFMEGRVQTGYSYLNSILTETTPGMAMINQPVEALDRWQQPGDKATFQRFTTGRNTAVLSARSNFMQSDGRFANASFLRAKNCYLSAGLPKGWLTRLHMHQGDIYFQSNNAITITHYRVLDPETQVFTTLPPLKTFLVGLKFGI